jgi:hypothetical protein
LVASSDDYLLEERLTAAVDEVCHELGGAEPEIQPDEITPRSLSIELVSPTLFASERVLVISDARRWFGAPAPAGVTDDTTETQEIAPLVHVLNEGLPEGVGLVIGAWCGRKPKGELVDAIEAAGSFEWIPIPPPPKPWEDSTALSAEQRTVLESVLRRSAGGVRFTPQASRLLLDRLGFAPRLLVTEVHKLVGAAGQSGEVDEALVRKLTFPKERSLEVVRESVLTRQLAPLLDLVAAAAVGVPINNWRGQRLEPGGLEFVLYSMVFNLVLQLLYIRRVVETSGLGRDLASKENSRRDWYRQRFKTIIAPELLQALKDDAPSPLVRPKAKPPTPWSLGELFRGAGRYTDAELENAVASAGEVEAKLRSSLAPEALTAWLTGIVAIREM